MFITYTVRKQEAEKRTIDMLLNRIEELELKISATNEEKQEQQNIKSGNERSMENKRRSNSKI